MTQTAINYAKVLYELSIPADAVTEMQEILSMTPELLQVLTSPVAKRAEKHRVIDRIFERSVRVFLKVVCDNQDAGVLPEIFQAYDRIRCQREGILPATLFYVTEPSENQLIQIKELLKRNYHASDVRLTLKKDKSLIGGFILRCGDRETDWSLRGRLRQLEQRLTRETKWR